MKLTESRECDYYSENVLGSQLSDQGGVVHCHRYVHSPPSHTSNEPDTAVGGRSWHGAEDLCDNDSSRRHMSICTDIQWWVVCGGHHAA